MTKIAIGALIFLTSVVAAQARTEWQGAGTVVALNQSCKDGGWKKGIKGNLRFRPAGLTGNGSQSGFSTFTAFFAFGVKREGLFSSTLEDASAYGISGGWFGPVSDTQFRFVSIKPKNITDSTKKIKKVVAEITNYGGNVGCTIQWKGNRLKKR